VSQFIEARVPSLKTVRVPLHGQTNGGDKEALRVYMSQFNRVKLVVGVHEENMILSSLICGVCATPRLLYTSRK
jgi:hypothetical protein